MKVIKCELCGSNDLKKVGDEYECQYCHTKYSLEDAKKLFTEVSGEVSVKNIGSISNYIEMARNALAASNNKEAENYANKAIELDTNNYEAWLIKGKAAGWQSTMANIRFTETINCFEKAVELTPEDKKDEVKKDAVDEARKLLSSLNHLACDHYIDYPSSNNATDIIGILASVKTAIDGFRIKMSDVDFSEDNKKLGLDINSAVVTAYSNTIFREYVGDEGHPDKFDFEQYRDRAYPASLLLDSCAILVGDDKESLVTIYQNKLKILEELVKASSYTKEYLESGGSYWRVEYTLTEETKQKIVDNIMETHMKWNEIDPTHEIPDRKSIKTKQGCYIATCVYGSYDCPQVWILRRYRDYCLAETWYGRLFIKTYYTISPSIVKIFGNNSWFKSLFKPLLDNKIKKLQKEGYASSKYNDKDWM